MKTEGKDYIKRQENKRDDAFDYIIDNYSSLVKGTVNKYLGHLKDQGLIEECVNDVFISVWNNLSKFKGDNTEFKKWIFVIARFKAIDYCRSSRRKAETVIEFIEIADVNLAENSIIAMENRREVIKLMNSLESTDRTIFLMKYFLGYKSEDIAIKLNMTRAAVDNRLYRGKRKLREKASNLNLEVVTLW